MIVTHLKSGSYCYKLRGIFECLDKRKLTPEETSALIALLNDKQKVDARLVCDFAAAACDVLDIQKYTGTNEFVH